MNESAVPPYPPREDGLFGGCPIYAEARTTSECGKCGGDLLLCPVYGEGERESDDFYVGDGFDEI